MHEKTSDRARRGLTRQIERHHQHATQHRPFSSPIQAEMNLLETTISICNSAGKLNEDMKSFLPSLVGEVGVKG